MKLRTKFFITGFAILSSFLFFGCTQLQDSLSSSDDDETETTSTTTGGGGDDHNYLSQGADKNFIQLRRRNCFIKRYAKKYYRN